MGAEQNVGPYVSQGLNRHGLKNPEVRAAMSRVPRHEFVPSEEQSHAYEDRAVSIGKGQTISQPYIVALMSENSAVTHGSKVLEIGTGSGYQAAVLAELGARVYTIEIIPELAERARETLDRLGYEQKVTVRQGDGWKGWPDEQPFDAILITASSPRIPRELLSQLANHGRMIIPLEEDKGHHERLTMIERNDDDFITRDLGAVKFVPLLGQARETAVPTPSPSITESVLGIVPDADNRDRQLSPLPGGSKLGGGNVDE
jgi:protein-L-isoaspartate(D-aspartate) O-methyltransferase